MPNNIERLIKQRIPFQSETVKALVGFMYVSYILQDAQQQYFKPFGITLQQYNILRILRGQFPKTSNINLIKERMIDRMSDVSRMIDRLVKLEMVTKEANTFDKRNVDVMITEKALNLLSEIDQLDSKQKLPISHLTTDEIRQLNQVIDRILENY
ncbi:MAG TPA: MarR family transcriptional regulator [Chitinophagaceae bacterium]|nr:MarR family transcriptional regulator [Chitinophagaceae bacterium]